MKLIAIIVLLILSTGIVAAAQGQNEPPGPPELPAVPTLYAWGDEGQPEAKALEGGQGQQVQTTTKAGSPEEVAAVRAQVQERSEAMNQEMEGKNDKEQKVYRNQNQVREAVQALKALGEMQGIGPKVSELAKGFDNSVQATLQAELKMEQRSGFKRFFAGGDHKAAQAMEAEVAQNQERLKEMQQVHDICDCDESVKTMLKEQIQTMTQEQARLQDRAEQEKSKKGLLGWMWK